MHSEDCVVNVVYEESEAYWYADSVDAWNNQADLFSYVLWRRSQGSILILRSDTYCSMIACHLTAHIHYDMLLTIYTIWRREHGKDRQHLW